MNNPRACKAKQGQAKNEPGIIARKKHQGKEKKAGITAKSKDTGQKPGILRTGRAKKGKGTINAKTKGSDRPTKSNKKTHFLYLKKWKPQ